MLSVLPPPQREPSDSPALPAVDVDALLNVTDPWLRSHLATEQAKHLESLWTLVLRIRRDAVGELVHRHHAKPSRVAAHLGLTRTRIGQLAQAALRALDGGDAR
jgi:hypothetical protein